MIGAANPAVKALKIPRNFCNQSYSNFVNKTPRESRITVIGKKENHWPSWRKRREVGHIPKMLLPRACRPFFLPYWEYAGRMLAYWGIWFFFTLSDFWWLQGAIVCLESQRNAKGNRNGSNLVCSEAAKTQQWPGKACHRSQGSCCQLAILSLEWLLATINSF